MVSVDCLFLDMNAFFASAEQQLRPDLRGRPVAIAPTLTDRTCCIAVSYEARPYGIKTGTNIGLARQRCPDLVVVEGRHAEYVMLHHQILAAVERVLPIEEVCSIDEMACRLDPRYRSVTEARRIAEEVKASIAHHVGPYMKCSVGLAPNRLLAKVASNLRKPNGLSVITREELPRMLYRMDLEDLPGIARNMRARLASRGVRSMRQLCALSREDLIEVWGSIVGAQWWHWLRGEECLRPPTERRTVSHSHILPPALRNDAGARGVFIRLIHKAAARLRKLGYAAQRLELSMSYIDETPRWKRRINLSAASDTPTLLRLFAKEWEQGRPRGARPIKTGLFLSRLVPARSVTRSLFPEAERDERAGHVLDEVNDTLGPHTAYFASMHGSQRTAPMRIAFTKIPDVDVEE